MVDGKVDTEARRIVAVKGTNSSAGKQYKPTGSKIGNPHLKWAFSEAITLLKRESPDAKAFAQRWTTFAAACPDDWDLAYLGGQHLAAPEPLAGVPGVVRCRNVNRTHAWAINGKSLPRVYRHLHEFGQWTGGHVDHHLGRLHQNGDVNVYAPSERLVGQNDGPSDIGDGATVRFWSGGGVPVDHPMVAVMGPFRGGTSCTAGVLHHLGVFLGRRLKPALPANRRGFFEAVQLGRICRRSYQEPSMGYTGVDPVPALRTWAAERRDDRPLSVRGGKHPAFCKMGPALLEAWGPDTRFVVVDRPVEESIRSLIKRGWGWPPSVVRRVLPDMVAERDKFVAALPADQVLRVDFAELLADPTPIIDRLVDFTGVSPSGEQFEAAVNFVNPELRTESIASNQPKHQVNA